MCKTLHIQIQRAAIRRISGLVCLAILLLNPLGLKSQNLVIQSIVLPDTLILNSTVELTVLVQNQGDTGDVGNLQLWFMNQTNDSAMAPLGGFHNTLQYFAPNQIRTFQLDIPITPEFFLEGGNTVVIWPSMVGQPQDPLNPLMADVYVLNPNGLLYAGDLGKGRVSVVNPVVGQLIIRYSDLSEKPSLIELYDFSGKLVKSSPTGSTGDTNVNELPTGIYLLRLRMSDGSFYQQKVIIANQ